MSSGYILTVSWILLTSVVSQYIIFAQTQDADLVPSQIFGSAEMKCSIPTDSGEPVMWMDYVNNNTPDPLVIFDSTNNPNRLINQDHPKKALFSVTKDFTLKFKNISETDVGYYYCKSGSDQKDYSLVSVGQLQCLQKEVKTMENDTITLSCLTDIYGTFGSNLPKLSWEVNKMATPSRDEYELGIAQQNVEFIAQGSYDKSKAVCKMEFRGEMDMCSVGMEVEYAVTNLQIVPEKDTYHVGEEVKCMASGNPTPKISWTPTTEGVNEAEGMTSFKIPADWEGMKKTVQCKASNVLTIATAERGFIHEKNITFTTIAAPKPEPTAEPVSGGDKDDVKPDESKGSEQAEPVQASSTGLIAGIIIAVVVIIIIIIAVVIIRRKRAKKGAQRVPTKEEEIRRDMEQKGTESAVSYRVDETKYHNHNGTEDNKNILVKSPEYPLDSSTVKILGQGDKV